MTIDEAIGILIDIPTQTPQYLGEVSFKAFQLAIGALRFVKVCDEISVCMLKSYSQERPRNRE